MKILGFKYSAFPPDQHDLVHAFLDLSQYNTVHFPLTFMNRPIGMNHPLDAIYPCPHGHMRGDAMNHGMRPQITESTQRVGTMRS